MSKIDANAGGAAGLPPLGMPGALPIQQSAPVDGTRFGGKISVADKPMRRAGNHPGAAIRRRDILHVTTRLANNFAKGVAAGKRRINRPTFAQPATAPGKTAGDVQKG
jgi:hypothetical protein